METKRDLMVECGHRCCACGETVSLELAHIIPWSAMKDHSFENLVVLCSVCHKLSHDQRWDSKTLKAYKAKPWVARYKGTPENGGAQKVFTLKLDATLDEFQGDRERVLMAISAALDICPKDVLTVSIEQGSIFLTVSVPEAAAQKLLLSQKAHEELRELLKPIKLISICADGDVPENPDISGRKMSNFNESNTVEAFIRDHLAGSAGRPPPSPASPGMAV